MQKIEFLQKQLTRPLDLLGWFLQLFSLVATGKKLQTRIPISPTKQTILSVKPAFVNFEDFLISTRNNATDFESYRNAQK